MKTGEFQQAEFFNEMHIQTPEEFVSGDSVGTSDDAKRSHS